LFPQRSLAEAPRRNVIILSGHFPNAITMMH
jgi:hypothetical protein